MSLIQHSLLLANKWDEILATTKYVQRTITGKSWQVLTLTLVYRSLPKLGSLNFATDFSLSQVQVGFFKEMSCNDLDYHRPTVPVVA